MVDKKKNSSRINIGDEVHRWKAWMMQLGMNSNELATFLMDRFVLLLCSIITFAIQS